MGEVRKLANECEHKVKVYTQIVTELQVSEDRNDEFMKQLLQRSENLEMFKVD